eukprot:TRINITY_DN81817_c0_g1_i1.p1 TRINITY_DN81817_c0_g1~~TRINITY_DN81817_c0_g1_i1.p1  ORF type:complete len:404 (+),score=29.92 TRINITY_DN81817_c0_g1_i1:264-1475(+)
MIRALLGLILHSHGAAATDFKCEDAKAAGAFLFVRLQNSKGMTGEMIAYGATMTHLFVPNKFGGVSDVILGCDRPEEYCENPEHTYFGATIGRVANRIAMCEFLLDGRSYNLPCNERGFDTLHSGPIGLDRRVWKMAARSNASVTWSYFSPDGEMGFPGNLHLNVTHTITEDNVWDIQYTAITDRRTLVALTNHAYFNLNANINNETTVLEHVLHIPKGDSMQEVTTAPDYHLIPTGRTLPIAPGSAWDFRSPKRLGKDIDSGIVTSRGGYDNSWIFSDWSAGMSARPVLTISSDLTGISLEMSTDQPCVQIYSGNALNGTDFNHSSPTYALRRKQSQTYQGWYPIEQYYQYRGAFTLEAQAYIGAANYPSFPSIVLSPGEKYVQHTAYAFSTTPKDDTLVVV